MYHQNQFRYLIMAETAKVIKSLRIFFGISNVVFDGLDIKSPMRELHKLALNELEKESPSLEIIHKLMLEMEKVAENSGLSK